MRIVPLAISSSMIAGAAHDLDAQELHVTFKSGDRWVYGNAGQPFTEEDAADFAAASSAGSHFLAEIRDVYPARRG